MKKLMIALVAVALIAVPAMAMDTISDSDLGGITGQAGVTIGFGGTQSTEIQFSALAWGDPDGYSTANTAGYLRIEGTVGVTIAIPSGDTLTLDVATTAGAATFDDVTIPASTTFIRVGLPNQQITVNMPSTMTIGLGDTAAAIDGTLGVLTLEGLSVSVTSSTALYIYAH